MDLWYGCQLYGSTAVAGETYTLHETNAPAGYVLAQDQQFTVNADGTVTKVNMKDDTTKVSITKYDLTSGKELPGATLQIIDKDGNVIENGSLPAKHI